MVYYHLQSKQSYSGGRTTGEDILKKVEGASIPANNQNDPVRSEVWCRNEYYANYEDARAQFDLIYKSYRESRAPSTMVLKDEVKGETLRYDG